MGETPLERVPLRFIRFVRTDLNQFGLVDKLGFWKRKKTTRSIGRYREHVDSTPPYGDGTIKRRIVDVFSVSIQNGFRGLLLPDVLSSHIPRKLCFTIFHLSCCFVFVCTGSQTEKQPFRPSDYVHNKFVWMIRLKIFGISLEPGAGGWRERVSRKRCRLFD